MEGWPEDGLAFPNYLGFSRQFARSSLLAALKKERFSQNKAGMKTKDKRSRRFLEGHEKEREKREVSGKCEAKKQPDTTSQVTETFREKHERSLGTEKTARQARNGHRFIGVGGRERHRERGERGGEREREV